MQYFDSDIDKGLREGLNRFASEYPNASTQQIDNYVLTDVRSRLEKCIQAWPDPCERRFVRLVSELYALAEAVRSHRSEPELQRDDYLSVMGFMSWFFNSFKHQ